MPEPRTSLRYDGAFSGRPSVRAGRRHRGDLAQWGGSASSASAITRCKHVLVQGFTAGSSNKTVWTACTSKTTLKLHPAYDMMHHRGLASTQSHSQRPVSRLACSRCATASAQPPCRPQRKPGPLGKLEPTSRLFIVPVLSAACSLLLMYF